MVFYIQKGETAMSVTKTEEIKQILVEYGECSISVEKDIWTASHDGDINTLSQLLPQATTVDLLYEEKVIIKQYIYIYIYIYM